MSEKTLFLGCHLSVSEGYEAMGKTALAMGANTFQWFTRNPKAPKIPPKYREEDITALVRLMDGNRFAPILAHAPYTYNPAAKDESIRDYTREYMAQELRFLEAIPHAYYNFHPGCHVGQGLETGIGYIADLLNTIVLPGQSTVVLLETMAGKGTEIGGKFEELAEIRSRLRPEIQEKVGVCLDTCHVNDAGYDIARDTDGVLTAFDKAVGLKNLYAVHLNDSKNVLNAHKDRHEKIGEGTLTVEGIVRIVTHPALQGLPFILETPNEIEGYTAEIAMLRKKYNDEL